MGKQSSKRRQNTLSDPASNFPVWHKSIQLIEARKYDEIALLLGELLQKEAVSELDKTLALIFVVAQEISLTCQQIHTEMSLYQQAYEDTVRREAKLQDALRELLEKASKIAAEPSLATMHKSQTADVSQRKGNSLLDRLQAMLPWKQISTAPSQKFDDLLPPKTSLSGNKPSLVIYFLGSFRVYHDNQLVSEWKSLKGLSILKYLLANHDKRVTKDTLMDIFWPDAPPESARRNLHQAIYSLRQTLIEIRPDFQHILYEADTYILNPELTTWIDYSEFDQHFHVGRQLESTGDMRAAMDAYAISEELYGGDFLEEELYETWMIPKRQVYQNCYVFVTNRLSDHFWRRGDLSTAVTYCRKLLTKDNCHEETHRRLIQCYMAQGQLQLAIRQYFTCVNCLQDELSVDPSPETNALYDHLINNA